MGITKLDVHGKSYSFTQEEINEAMQLKNACMLSYQDIGVICLVLRYQKEARKSDDRRECEATSE